jgi:hypothetical protein
MRERTRPATVVRGVAVLSVGALLLVVLGAATVAVLAEFAKTWRWYFRMEQAMGLAAPASVALLCLAIAGLLGVVAFADRD